MVNQFTGNPLKKWLKPQNPVAPEGLTVSERVIYGRFPYQKSWGSLGKEDKEMVLWTIEVTNMTEFRHHPVDQLSGGQRQVFGIEADIIPDPRTGPPLCLPYELVQFQSLNCG